ncbi:hypothetical protein [Sediminibacterium goheungense]|uniref:Uncharacterized protein n=1 Tax=Sediminibacterium goheungense TaxID=1086393 RepID=A0A4V3C5D1_9BACT|nr:hypothetical protein [Sediminibacterium goheungense]TDO29398.1 hypothetical protein BC659_1487 [Sediminibacterium goheungense]
MQIKTILSFFLIFLVSCSTGKQNQHSLNEIPDILTGSFEDDYGIQYSITRQLWTQGIKAKYHLLQYNKTGNYFIARNDKANPSDGGLYTRIDILYLDNMDPWHWGYCLTAFKAGSIEEAIHTAAADRKNPKKGCNGFPFSRMREIIRK